MIRWWVVIGMVAAIVGGPGVVTARFLSNQAVASERNTQSFQLGSVKNLTVAASCDQQSAPVVTVRWSSAESALTDGFEIRRHAANATGFEELAGVAGQASDYSDSRVAAGMTYTYSIRAMNAAWSGDASTTSTVTVASCA